jgi:hypothetical protein
MSQAGKAITAGGAAGPVLTLTADNAVAVTPFGGTINVLGDGVSITTTGNNGTHSITISSGQTDLLQTIDATQQTLATITLAPNEVVLVNSQVVGAYQAASNAAIGGDFEVLVRKQGAAGAAIIGNIVPIAAIKSNGSTAQITVATAGNTVTVRVTGEAATTINWKSVTTVVRQLAP